MTITIERGTETTASAVDFTGTVNLRRMHVRKDVAEAATKELTRAFTGNTFEFRAAPGQLSERGGGRGLFRPRAEKPLAK